MLFPIDELCKERPELKVVTEHLQLLSHPSVDELQHATDSLLSARTSRNGSPASPSSSSASRTITATLTTP